MNQTCYVLVGGDEEGFSFKEPLMAWLVGLLEGLGDGLVDNAPRF